MARLDRTRAATPNVEHFSRRVTPASRFAGESVNLSHRSDSDTKTSLWEV